MATRNETAGVRTQSEPAPALAVDTTVDMVANYVPRSDFDLGVAVGDAAALQLVLLLLAFSAGSLHSLLMVFANPAVAAADPAMHLWM